MATPPEENWDRVQELFLAAVELPPVDRSAYLNAACAENAVLRREIESLLATEASAGASLHSGVAETAGSLLG